MLESRAQFRGAFGLGNQFDPAGSCASKEKWAACLEAIERYTLDGEPQPRLNRSNADTLPLFAVAYALAFPFSNIEIYAPGRRMLGKKIACVRSLLADTTVSDSISVHEMERVDAFVFALANGSHVRLFVKC
jgi:hypothetical protein